MSIRCYPVPQGAGYLHYAGFTGGAETTFAVEHKVSVPQLKAAEASCVHLLWSAAACSHRLQRQLTQPKPVEPPRHIGL